jgi:hypothetical protein
MQLLTIIFGARVVQALGMAGFAAETFGVGRRWSFRPRLSRWLWRSGMFVASVTFAIIAAAFADAAGWHGIMFFTPCANAILWVVLYLHVKATRRAAQRSSPAFVDGLSVAADDLIADMEKSAAKATRALAWLGRRP